MYITYHMFLSLIVVASVLGLTLFMSGWYFGSAHEIGLEIEEDEFADEDITDADYPPVW